MSKPAAALIAAMHTQGGDRGRYVLAWHTLAQSNDALCAAFRAVFGKRFPTLQKLGQWLSEHIGAQGDYLLEGKHSLKRKAWAYRVVTLAEVAEQERVRREEEAAVRAQHQEQQAAVREAERQRAEVAERDRQHAAEAEVARFESSPYEYETKINGQGHTTRKLIISSSGEPLRKIKPVAQEKPPEPERPIPQTNLPASKLPPWTREGRRPTRAELAAAHRGERHPSDYPDILARDTCSAPSPWHGNGVDPMHSSTGVRQDPGGVSTLWNRTLRDL